MVPVPDGMIDQVTALFEVLATVAVNCCVWLWPSVAVLGVMLTAMEGVRVIVAEAVLVVFAALVAMMVTVCCVLIVAGAR